MAEMCVCVFGVFPHSSIQLSAFFALPSVSFGENCTKANAEFVLCSNYFLLYKLPWNEFEFSKQTL